MSNDNDNAILTIFKDGVLVDVDVRFWSGSKRLSSIDLGLEETTVVDAFKLGKRFLIPAEVVQNFRRIEGRARAIVDDNSFPFPIGNAKFVPHRVYEKVQTNLKQQQAEYLNMVDTLITKYEEYRNEMKPVYEQAAEEAFARSKPPTVETFGPDYDPDAAKRDFVAQYMARVNADYPPAASLRERYSLDWSAYQVSPIKSVDQEYREKMTGKIDSFVNDVVGVLRNEAVEICSRISKLITEGKVIKSTTIDSLRTFIERFKDLNFVGDADIEAQLEAVRKELLDTHPVEEIRDNVELKAELQRRLTVISEAASQVTDVAVSSVTGEYKRKISLE